MDLLNIRINGKDYQVENGVTILEACRKANIHVPTLCYMKEINAIGACRICLVDCATKVGGPRKLVASCVMPVSDGMEVFTNTPAVRKARKLNLELLLSDHEKKCLSCVRSQNCELQTLAKEYGVDEDHFAGKKNHYELETSTAFLVRDNNKCIGCRRCVSVCKYNQGAGVIGANDRGFDTHIGCAFETPLGENPCIGCGQCVVACPTGALREKDDTDKVLEALADPTKHVAICSAPSIRATLGECFGMEPGTDVEGKMVAAMKALGFDGVYDMNFSADLTIMEEATELVERVKNGGALPMITSCSPGWIKYCEHYFPEFIPNLSTCKSPQQMFGAVYKTFYAEKHGIDPKDIVFVSCIPCTAKKFEVTRDHQNAAGVPDVDIAITTRELSRLIMKAGINFKGLEDEKFDTPFEIGTGAGAIFGATGGVMEAALRYAAEVILEKPFEKVDYTEVRGTDPIKTTTYKIGDLEVKVAVTSGTANAQKLLIDIKEGKADYTFVEVMACPGGCVNGGGQPYQPMSVRNNVDLKAIRAKVLYDADKNLPYRKSQDNPIIKMLYKEYFGKPGSHKAHEVLHTSYVARGKY